jgi:hypothetical protein
MLDGDADGRGQSVPAWDMKPGDWEAIDEVLGKFTAASVIPLLSAAIDAPRSQPWHHPLTLLWFRAACVPPSGERAAGSADLGDLVDIAVEIGRYPVLPSGVPNDPRLSVGFTIAGRRWRLHPGDYLYPPMLLRRLASTAVAVDATLLHALGFTLTDVIEVALVR